ncbi:A24 family peptidase [Halalkalicoccus subterraneus]|uniref:A24 family peptidase n=1 Tax=Halalkalicoccus subterraneus TaxID=2675002 RepID=UPI001B85D452|nr:A24 family peptidase [Halalkalicoccus subterraneus]
MPASVPDLLRLLAVPVLLWAAHRDVRTRRVPDQAWQPLFALACVLFVWDGIASYQAGGSTWILFAIGAGISLLLVIPASYGFWHFGAFGGADAKALIVLTVLFPTIPSYAIGSYALPLVEPPTGAFALTILSNTVLVGACYPLVLALRNALAGRFTPWMVVGWPVHWRELRETHGRLLETESGFTRSGLDLDALRMYLRWRGTTLAELREEPDRFRDPGSLPAEPSPAGDGAITDGGRVTDDWGAEAFLADVGSAYGTTPASLREGLDVLTMRETVWVSPGIPFLVPILVGLLVGLTYGDVLTAALRAVGMV